MTWVEVVQIATAVSALGLVAVTGALVLVTAVYVVLAYLAINDTRDARVKEGLPQVVLFFEMDPIYPNAVFIVLQNYGRRPAYNIRVDLINDSPPLVTRDCPKSAFPTRGAKFLAGGQSLKALFAWRLEVFQEDLLPDYKFNIAYWDMYTQHIYDHPDTISLEDFRGISPTGPPSSATVLSQFHGDIKRIADTVDPEGKYKEK